MYFLASISTSTSTQYNKTVNSAGKSKQVEYFV